MQCPFILQLVQELITATPFLQAAKRIFKVTSLSMKTAPTNVTTPNLLNEMEAVTNSEN